MQNGFIRPNPKIIIILKRRTSEDNYRRRTICVGQVYDDEK